MNRLTSSFLMMALALTATEQLHAQTAASKEQDEAAVRQAGKDYVAALEKGDAKAIAEFWTAEGSYTDASGHVLKVRDLIEKHGTNTPMPRQQGTLSNVMIRFLTADVAVEEADATVRAGENASTKGHFKALWVRQGGRWRLESLQETAGETVADAELLAGLEPFVGVWTGEIEKSTIRVSAKWNSTKKFLTRDFSMTSNGKTTFGGTQQIGWDPLTRQIKSWSFNDDGSRAEGLWSFEGYLWMTASSRLLPDGKSVTSVHTYKFLDKDKLVWRSIDGKIDGQPVPDFEVTLKRVKNPN